ncbi:hypothetical protein RM190_23300 [Paracoccus sp. CPCC 101403]|uniref:Uncharacterized protein n=1 Tax=Paracoccus broussonetiae TaxID=3075834 RepID=A0ABU3EKM5_9RHOB|nr:hypothetical protein [Paracoccus sp. CPCC 101403]MDT1064796.1 hypothetical protein [Paracoccus sp. CPCC 101403]
MNAILAGTPADRIRDRMAKLEARQKQLEAEVPGAAKGGPPPTLLHPRIAETYHVQVSKVIEALQDADHEGDAKDTIRALIEQITVTPEPGSGKRPLPRIDLRGPRCGDSVLEPECGLVSGQQNASCAQEVVESVGDLVAGAGFEPATFRL